MPVSVFDGAVGRQCKYLLCKAGVGGGEGACLQFDGHCVVHMNQCLDES